MLDLINRREEQILVHAILYYQFDESIWEDRLFDRVSLELVKLRDEYPSEFKQSKLFDIFKTFDAGTGYDLPFNVNPYYAHAQALFWYIREHPLETIYVEDFYKDYDIDKYLGI